MMLLRSIVISATELINLLNYYICMVCNPIGPLITNTHSSQWPTL